MKITDSNYKDIIENNNSIIYLGAPWCPGCKILKPIIEELISENKTSIVIGIVNVDEDADISTTYNIRQIPTVLFFKDNKLIDKLIGNTTNKDIILNKIKDIY